MKTENTIATIEKTMNTVTENKKEEAIMKETTITEKIVVEGIVYTEKNNRYYKTDSTGKTVRIGVNEFREAKEAERIAWEAEAEAERKAQEDRIAAEAKETEEAINKKEDKPTEKKSRKPRKSKDIAFEDEENKVTLTAKQVDFILHLSDSDFWTEGLDSSLWCDVLCDEITGQFAGKPMTVGAMISTLCEKGLADRTKDRMTDVSTGRSRTATTFSLTVKGKLIAGKLGLK